MKGRLNRESNPVPGEKPGFLPQHESETSGEFVVTGERNPFPVRIKNIDEQAIPVQLTGSNVGYRERVVVIDSLAIADTSNYYYFINEELSRRTLRMTLEIYNTLDQPVRVALLSNARLSGADVIRDHEGKEYLIEVPGNQDFKPYLFTGKNFPILDYPTIANLGQIRFRVSCPIAPTKGFVNLVANLFFV